MWRVSALQAGAEAQPPRRALVRPGGIGEEGGGRRQAGGFGGGGPGRAAGDTAGAALVRAPVRAGESRDRVGAAHPAPPRDTVFVLTSAEPDALLPTILSRVVRVRVARNANSIVTAFAQRELGLKSQHDIAERVTAADGSIGKLLATEETAGGTGRAAEAFQAAVAGGAVQRYGFALRQAPFQARGGFTAMLDGLLEQLRNQARAGGETGRVVEAIARTLDARELAQGNVNPQLVAAVLADQLAERK